MPHHVPDYWSSTHERQGEVQAKHRRRGGDLWENLTGAWGRLAGRWEWRTLDGYDQERCSSTMVRRQGQGASRYPHGSDDGSRDSLSSSDARGWWQPAYQSRRGTSEMWSPRLGTWYLASRDTKVNKQKTSCLASHSLTITYLGSKVINTSNRRSARTPILTQKRCRGEFMVSANGALPPDIGYALLRSR